MKKYTVFIVFSFFAIAGFSQSLYIHDHGFNTLVPTYENNFLLEFQAPTSSQGTKLSVAYSPIKHLSLQTGIIDASKKEINNFRSKGSKYSLSVGTYYHSQDVSRKDDSRVIRLLVSAHLGIQTGRKQEFIETFKSDFRFQKLFTQAQFGFHYNNWKIDMVFRRNWISYKNGFVDQGYLNSRIINAVEEIEANNFFTTSEVKLKFGYQVKFVTVFFGTSAEWSPSETQGLFLDGALPYFGLTLDLNMLLKKKFSLKKKS